ncbi:MAG: hypothetical protein DSZ06_03105 [Sulfurospirillum sp.]|nr:MAG: hypothetical protein DSZ06_03105 [Sulfurospirillum sp.]
MSVKRVFKFSLIFEFATVGMIGLLLVLMAVAIVQKAQITEVFSLDSRTLHLLSFSITQALLSTILSLLLGILFAWSLHYKREFWGRSVIISLLSSSLVLPSIIVAFGIIGVYGQHGWLSSLLGVFGISFGSIYSLKGIVLAHVYLNSSYATKALLDSLGSISLNRYKLSHSLGLSRLELFRYVEFTAMLPTIKGVARTIFLLCFSSFAIVLLLGGGPQNSTLEVAIYEAIRIDFDLQSAIKYTLLQMSVAFVIILLSSKNHLHLNSTNTKHIDLHFLKSRDISLLQTLLVIFFTLFFITPLIHILLDGLDADLSSLIGKPLFIKSLSTSLFIATLSALLSLPISLMISDLLRNFSLNYRLKNISFSLVPKLIITLIGNIYLAVSSLVLGLGFFLISLWLDFDQELISWFALIFANILLTLPFAISIIYPILYKIGSRYDRLLLSLDISFYDEWKFINLPHLKNALIYIFTLSFCFSLGDLGIIALFGNEDFTTLPWYLYSLMGSYQNSDASGVGLIMLVLTLFIFITGEYFANRFKS